MVGTAQKVQGWRWEMRAANSELVRTQVPAFEANEDHAIVRVVGCGVCHTDLGYLFDGVRTRHPLPLALGHEIAGEVVAAGGRWHDLVGRAVIVPAVTPCGTCEDCTEGRAAVCKRQVMPGNDVQGGFASHVVVPARGLCPVDVAGALEGRELGSSGATLADLAVIADAVSTPYQAICRSGLSDGDFAIVVGLGGVGGYAAQIAHSLGATVVGIDVDPLKLEALKHYGVDLAVDAKSGEQAAVEAIKKFAAERGIRPSGWRIYECSGSKAGQALAWRLLGPAGWLSVVGFTLEKLELRLSNLMAFDAIAAGNWGCVPELYPEILQLVLDGRVKVKPFVQQFPMDQVWSVLNGVHEKQIRQRPVLVP